MDKSVHYKPTCMQIAKCNKCPGLNHERVSMSAPGYGDLNAKVMLVGQSLHSYNPETPNCQIPFIGPSDKYDSGNLLLEALKASGHQFSDFFTTNALHCHPPGNRPATEKETENCLKYLGAEIELVKPRLVIALGNDARNAIELLGIKFNSDRGKVRHTTLYHTGYFRRTLSILSAYVYHPSYVLRKGNQLITVQWKMELVRLIKLGYQQ